MVKSTVGFPFGKFFLPFFFGNVPKMKNPSVFWGEIRQNFRLMKTPLPRFRKRSGSEKKYIIILFLRRFPTATFGRNRVRVRFRARFQRP